MLEYVAANEAPPSWELAASSHAVVVGWSLNRCTKEDSQKDGSVAHRKCDGSALSAGAAAKETFPCSSFRRDLGRASGRAGWQAGLLAPPLTEEEVPAGFWTWWRGLASAAVAVAVHWKTPSERGSSLAERPVGVAGCCLNFTSGSLRQDPE
mmetsp:Transcript_65132/g.174624  ORF Transcript_65132/g.174624 Transcript_65132/m.174624 type:complete len:152 (+) Transcript_65132:257-712(+)